MEDLEQIERICASALESVGYELVELEFVREQQGPVLRVYIDFPPGGEEEAEEAEEEAEDARARAPAGAPPAPPPPSAITHQDCEAASRHLGTVLDVEDPIHRSYRLEVSSPGVQRPLRMERHFRRYRGHRVRVEMLDAVEGRRRFLGLLLGVEQGRIDLEVDGRRYSLPIARVRRARLEVDL